MALNGYTANHKIWDRMGRITPNVEWSESHRPHSEWMVASWLPVQRYDQEYEAWFTVSSGKIVALDRELNLVPAGLKKAFNVATSSTALSYSSSDVGIGVIDLVTGELVAAAVDYTEAQVTAALRERGLIKATERATDFISKPVGYASSNYYKASGTDTYNPANLFQHNFRPQALVSIGCDYVNTYPVLPAVTTAETVGSDLTGEADGLLEDVFDGSEARASYLGFYSATQIAEVTRYSSVTSDSTVMALVLADSPMAVVTEDSPIATSVENCLVREVESIAAIAGAGDYFIDYEVGVILLYSADGETVPSPWVASSTTITYYNYAAAGSNVSTFACATGDLQAGDFVTYDSNSNLVKATLDIGTAEGYVTAAAGALYSSDPDYDDAGEDAAISAQIEKAIMGYTTGIVGQVIGVVNFGDGRFSKTYLDRVKTGYEGYSAANMQTPGSATGGRTDQLTYANGAERMVIVNMILR